MNIRLYAIVLISLTLIACTRSRQQIQLGSASLLATDQRMEVVRDALFRGSAHHVHTLAHLQERVLAEDLDRFERSDEDWNYARSYLAQSAAFLFRLSGEQRYADIAYRSLEAVYEDPEKNHRFPESGAHGLSRATVGLGFALAYAWCAEAWDQEQQDFVRSALHRSLAMWKDFRHANLGASRVSNWVSVCRGSELIQILALGERDQRQERYEFLIQELTHHITNGFDQIGATQEGVGYTDYGSIFLLPAIIASADAGDPRLLQLLRHQGKALHRKAAYAHSPAAVPAEHRLAGRNITLYSGVGGLGAGNQGWPSLLFPVASAEDLPFLRWWYDYTLGVLRPYQQGHLIGIEPMRQAAIWALLFYPQWVEAESPEGQWPLMISGDKGRHYIRRRWRDERDIMLNIHAQTTHHGRAWAMIELGQWSLTAYGRPLVVGPRLDRSGHQSSMLQVENQERGSRRDAGRVIEASADQQTALVIIDGEDYFAHLGADSYQRHLLAHFSSPDENRAVLAMLDRIDAHESHTYHWGLPVLDELVAVSIDNSQDFPQAVISSPQGGQLSLWIISPQGLEWTQEEGRIAFAHSGKSGELLVAMSLRDDAAGQIEQMKSDIWHQHLRIDGIDLIHDRVADRLLVGDAARAWQVPQQLPPIRGLEAEARGQGQIALHWFAYDRELQEYQIQGRSNPKQDFITLQSLRPDQWQSTLSGLQPETTYELRIIGRYDGMSAVSDTLSVRTWDVGQDLFVEDFAPVSQSESADPAAHRLGQWQMANQDRGWQFDDGEGSSRGARSLSGHLRTERVRRGHSNAVFLDSIRADCSGPTAAMEVDLRSQNTVHFAPLLRLADGRWVRAAGLTAIESRLHWQTQAWVFADIEEWQTVDLATMESGERLTLSSEALANIRGIGVYANWPINERWARIDQLHLYARDVSLGEE